MRGINAMNARNEFREGAAANCVLRDGFISVFSLHSVHETAPFYLNELSQRFEDSVDPKILGEAVVQALRDARYLAPEERGFPDAMEVLRGKKSHRAFHRGMGFVGIGYHRGKLEVGGWESDGRGHVPAAKLNRSIASSVSPAALGAVILKILRASQQINIPAVGWDRHRVKPL
jgi:hypothetical protein